MDSNTYPKVAESCEKFHCDSCDYKCSRKSSWDKHLTTAKHQNTYQYLPKKLQKIYTCDCNKIYNHKQSLYAHRKKCIVVNKTSHHNVDIIDTTIILQLLKQNDEFKSLIIEQNKTIFEQNNKLLDICKNGTHNTNSHNKTFNLQVFLNETCKDAMNIMEFVDSIKLQLSDFERVGEVGFVNGISDIIIKNLKQLDITERPIHCTDKKREIMYVKDENKWEKEDDTNKKVRRAIKYIANKNINLMDAYKALHPDCQKSHSVYSDSYNKFVIEALGGSGNEDCDNEDKIISRLSKVVAIEK